MSLTNNQVAHLWANQSKPSARTSNGNMSFIGPVLYSYSTPIANIVADDVALFSERTYSITTAGKHMGPARRALGYVRTINVDVVCPIGPLDHERNLAGLHGRIAEAEGKARRAHSDLTRDRWTDQAALLVSAANRYARHFNIDVPAITSAAEITAVVAEAQRRNVERRRQAEAAAATAEAERRAQWLAGADVRAPRHGDICLRIKPSSPETLETSWGAEVPLSHAVRIFRMADVARRTGREVVPSADHRPSVGHFRLDRIDADGTIHAGCHRIVWSEAERLAVLLGVLEAA